MSAVGMYWQLRLFAPRVQTLPCRLFSSTSSTTSQSWVMAIRISIQSPAVSPGMAARSCHIAGSAPRADELTEAVTFHLATAARVRCRRAPIPHDHISVGLPSHRIPVSQRELNVVALLPSVNAGRYSTLSLRSLVCGPCSVHVCLFF
jgi:hypothetical protein